MWLIYFSELIILDMQSLIDMILCLSLISFDDIFILVMQSSNLFIWQVNISLYLPLSYFDSEDLKLMIPL